jgi:hypothetical protein
LKDYKFQAAWNFNNSGVVSNFLGFITNRVNCNGDRCPSKCTTNEECQSYKGVLLEKTCFICKITERFQGYQCVPSVICPVYSAIDYNNNCICNNGYYMYNNQCIPSIVCPAYSTLVNNKCICNIGYNMNNFNQCIFIINCPSYSTLINNKCVCNSGYNMNNFNQCVSIINCPSYSTLINSKCVCNSGYIMNNNNNQCLYNICPINSTPSINGNTVNCICISGYKFSNGICVVDYTQQCPYRATYNAIKYKCECSYNG